ncbi:hypothetical protein M011DRAFT_398521 [Sporormia fimetaria CBS 119925]|uniref:Fe2OG dioxygenase domain-containing protein n=1 Tax=Sporormia fimetaria CBS 119925 TaxID=1340428 RepID=A0A6A6VFC4_9PLEO|nr:hypothetical protein M011DRAFT_398521 [Sporormia fimetaria CBS 119925]
MASSSSSVSLSSVIQYTLFAVVAYFLAGAPYLAPLLSVIGVDEASFSSSSLSASSSEDVNTSNQGHQYAHYGRQDAHTGAKRDNLWQPGEGLVCEGEHGHGYKTYVLRRDPLVVYVEGFLSEAEREALLALSAPNWAPSTIWTAQTEHLDPKIRNSLRAPLNLTQPPTTPFPPTNPLTPSLLLPCLSHRAHTFQGSPPPLSIEQPLWTQKYLAPSGHYTYHYDFSDPGYVRGTAGRQAPKIQGRKSTFMVYVSASEDLQGGGTNFPRLEKPVGEWWCRFVYCDGVGDGEEEVPRDKEGQKVEGITFRPIPGNAVFWENLREDGNAYYETWHAGLPVTRGEKVGLNVWSWWEG